MSDFQRDRLIAAVDEFAAAMKKRLIYKADVKGYHGWDTWLNSSILSLLVDAMKKPITLDTKPYKLIDLANFAMFLWLRLRRKK